MLTRFFALAALVAVGCNDGTGETTDNAAAGGSCSDATFAAPVSGTGGTSSTMSTAASIGGSTSAPSSKLCVPGASVSCACTDGTTSAQTCATDGQSYGVCGCKETAVLPDGYSGKCVKVGLAQGSASAWCQFLGSTIYVNCAAEDVVPGGATCSLPIDGYIHGLSGARCCI